MSDKHRALPAWMSKKEKKEEKVKEPLKSKRKPKVARSVFYCMNEKELVEAAVSYLSSRAREDLQSEHKTEPKTTAQTEEETGKTGSKRRTLNPAAAAAAAAAEASVESSDSTDALDRTYVSESDVDITEVETLPYPVCTEGNKEREVQDCKVEEQKVNKDNEKEDDPFQLVREIFFT